MIQNMKRLYPYLVTGFLVAFCCLAFNQTQAAPGDGDDTYRNMTESELQQFWQDALGPEAIQHIEMPRYVQPGGNYNDRIFYFSEPGSVRLEGTGAGGKIYIGSQTFSYRAAIHPYSQDSAISYFRILENNDFGALIDQQFPGLAGRSTTPEGAWNLLSIGEEMGIPLEMGSYFEDWTNLPNFQWVVSSILVRRASQTAPGQVLLLDQGDLRSIDQNMILSGERKTGLLAAVYDPTALDGVSGGGKLPLWMVIAIAGGAFLLAFVIALLIGRRSGRKSTPDLQPGEAVVLEEDPRFVALSNDLNQPLEPKDLLKVLAAHFDESENVASVLTQTKLLLDKALKSGDGSNISTARGSQGQASESGAENSGSESKEEGKGGRIKISMSNQDVGKKPSVEGKAEQEGSDQKERPAEKPEAKQPEREKPREQPRDKPRRENTEPEVREVIREVIKEVVIKETPNKDKLLIRLANQETAEEKLLAAVSFWDAEFEMEGEMNSNLKTVLRGYRTLKKVKEGFEDNKVRSALNTLALSIGGGHTETVKKLMDRSEIIDQFVHDIAADQQAPEALRTDDRGKTAGQFAELIRALDCMERVARRELGNDSVADYTKATENLMNGFLLDGIGRDVDSNKDFDEVKARLEGRLGLFRDDVRFAQHQLPEDVLARANRLVLAFNSQVGENEFYKAFMARYGDLFDKLSQYEDPPTLEQLREWWSQVFEMVIHSFDYFRYSMNPKEGNVAKLNVLMVTKGLKLAELPDGDVRPFSERVTDVPRAVRNAREMARSIGISRLDRVLIEGYYVHPKALQPVE